MALQKNPVVVNFAKGLQTKIDALQLPVGNFVRLRNVVFDKIGLLKKRFGFGSRAALPDASSTHLTTFSGNLTAIGSDLKAFNEGTSAWFNKGKIQPVSLDTLALVRNNSTQGYADSAISNTGLVCTAYTELTSSGSTTATINKYVVADYTTGQNIVAPTQITSLQGQVVFSPKVFTLGNYFIVTFTTSSSTAYRLQYFPISTHTPGMIGSVTDISTNYVASATGAFDGVVANNNLYLTWNGASTTGLKQVALTSNLSLSSVVSIASQTATIVSVTADKTQSSPVIWSSGYVLGSNTGSIVATNASLAIVQSAKQFISSTSVVTNLSSNAANGTMNLLYEVTNSYTYDSSIPSNFINAVSIGQSSGSVSNATLIARSVGLASKQFLLGSQSYFLSSYQSPYQPTYFLMGSSGGAILKLSYSNGGGYLTTGLPQASIVGSTAYFAYLTKATIQSVSKDTNVSSTTQTAGIYAQTGVNLAKVSFGTNKIVTSELGKNLNINGGYLYGYDGYQITENNFHLYPDSVQVTNPTTTVASGSAGGGTFTVIGSLSFQNYFYQSTYEWSDNQGNLFRSSPSIPVQVTTVASASNLFGANVLKVPTLRVTSKTQNPVKIVIYRWSTNQQVYYQTTSIVNPIYNSLTTDFISYTDRLSDAAILGNNILYTNGGVLENFGGPPCKSITTWDNRLWAIDAEDQNLLWFSKPVLEETPVEMTGFQTVFVSPNAGAQGPTGVCRCLAPMDDKLIIFKKNAIYYINGRGPDSTGGQNQYSEPIFITTTAGCDNQDSIVLTPSGLMFQSDKGIWILGRDLSTQYIGQEVEEFNSAKVLSAVTVPGTNQVRFTLDSGTTLMYDYFVGQWGEFYGANGISSTLYEDLHTYIDNRGRVFQETPGRYLDGSNPVLMSFTTGWFSFAGLQGYKRIYKAYLLATYKSPHKFSLGIAYDYDASIVQLAQVTPSNYSSTYGGYATWGSGQYWGGISKKEQWQINFERQQCQSFQLSFNEYFDPTVSSASAGEGLTMSAMTLVAGFIKGFPGNISDKNRTG